MRQFLISFSDFRFIPVMMICLFHIAVSADLHWKEKRLL